MKKKYSPSELAELLDVTRATIYREMKRGKLTSMMIGGRRYYTIEDIKRYVGEDRYQELFNGED